MNRLDGAYGAEPDDLDIWTADRLLDGALPDSEIPAGYEEVASLLSSIRQGVAPAPSGWGSRTVPAMAQIITASPRRHVRRRSVIRARRLSHAAAAAGVFALLGSGTAAAASGALPAPVQAAVHSAAATVGLQIPQAVTVAHTPSVEHQGSTATSQAPVPQTGLTTVRASSHAPTATSTPAAARSGSDAAAAPSGQQATGTPPTGDASSAGSQSQAATSATSEPAPSTEPAGAQNRKGNGTGNAPSATAPATSVPATTFVPQGQANGHGSGSANPHAGS